MAYSHYQTENVVIFDRILTLAVLPCYVCKRGASNFITSTRGDKLPILIKTEIQRIANDSFYKGKALKSKTDKKKSK